MTKAKKPDVMRELVKKCGPAETWVGNCYGLACAAAPMVGGVAVYGHWTGPIAKGSMFQAKQGGFCQHGWVQLPDGSIFDPTRWAFEVVEPYLYRGPADHYDEGGNVLRQKLIGPCPEFDPYEEIIHLSTSVLASEPFRLVEKLLGGLDTFSEQQPGDFNRRQLAWLAHVSYDRLGAHAPAIYKALEKLGMKATVPIDNWRRAEREGA